MEYYRYTSINNKDIIWRIIESSFYILKTLQYYSIIHYIYIYISNQYNIIITEKK